MLTNKFIRFAENKIPEQLTRKPIPGIGRIILTSGSKGGVGKSTIAINTAIALKNKGYKIGLFDGNIYGPSIARMIGTTSILHISDPESNYFPIIAHGIETASVSNVIDQESSLLWKAPYVGAVLGDFLKKCIWSNLDYLIIDTPAGTGDIQMALSTLFPVDGALLVTTPDPLSETTVTRCADMFKRMPIPIIGVLQNMDGISCTNCKSNYKIYEYSALESICNRLKLDPLGKLPIVPEISESSDKGIPYIISNPNSIHSKTFDFIAETIIRKFPKKNPEIPSREIKNPPQKPKSI